MASIWHLLAAAQQMNALRYIYNAFNTYAFLLKYIRYRYRALVIAIMCMPFEDFHIIGITRPTV